ncbi:MAG: 3-deoxy-manno-octulosonate cytidylyltransferase [Bacteroidales bacterium]|nr:3-deoxy-manno-octulosonate cytidylyltransferase [Bacteroidales bacterium]MBO7647594.1 3-deoxy-manno-octulosonate cytidylyltransferase [Bacteroidales bacterium]
MRHIGIIPARYASTRFPGKPLAIIQGKPMIQRVYEQVKSSSLSQVIVATDHPLIRDCVQSFGGEVMMTSPDHPSGTDRCGEVAAALNLDPEDVILNIQGDEPGISDKEISLLTTLFQNPDVNLATLVKPFTDEDRATNPNVVKAVLADNGKVLYFSRHAIPYQRDPGSGPVTRYQHLGIYAYRFKTLQAITKLKPSFLEKTEKLEQLRWLQNGFDIYATTCDYQGIGIDTPEDLELFNAQYPQSDNSKPL